MDYNTWHKRQSNLLTRSIREVPRNHDIPNLSRAEWKADELRRKIYNIVYPHWSLTDINERNKWIDIENNTP